MSHRLHRLARDVGEWSLVLHLLLRVGLRRLWGRGCPASDQVSEPPRV